uniref:Uncharacterized protein n=1 Tax=Siphoviridae sp. ctr2f5 TaxID=2825684 RepID=A0A8S5QEZ1_9CAUD|nr:MAG TPA: hypothetical protein [Siphoviridae sp. ctr2f5]
MVLNDKNSSLIIFSFFCVYIFTKNVFCINK